MYEYNTNILIKKIIDTDIRHKKIANSHFINKIIIKQTDIILT